MRQRCSQGLRPAQKGRSTLLPMRSCWNAMPFQFASQVSAVRLSNHAEAADSFATAPANTRLSADAVLTLRRHGGTVASR